MARCIPLKIERFLDEVIPQLNRWYQTGFQSRMDVPWDVLKRSAHRMWMRYRAFIRTAEHQGLLVLNAKGQRLSGSVAAVVPARNDYEAQAEYEHRVMLPGEIEFRNACSVLLRACAVACLPEAIQRYRIRRADCDDAVNYVVEQRLLYGDAVQFAFGPTRVRRIKSKDLFLQRFDNYAENERRRRRGLISIDASSHNSGRPFSAQLPDNSEPAWKSVDNADELDRVCVWLKSNPPVNMTAETACLILEGIGECGKNRWTALSEWLTKQTGEFYNPQRARRAYRHVATAIQKLTDGSGLDE